MEKKGTLSIECFLMVKIQLFLEDEGTKIWLNGIGRHEQSKLNFIVQVSSKIKSVDLKPILIGTFFGGYYYTALSSICMFASKLRK